MNIKKLVSFVCCLILAIVLFSVIRTAIEGEKGKIKRLIFSARRAIEKEDLVRLIGYISFNYQDRYGNDRETFLFLGKTIFNEYQDITLKMRDLKIELVDSESFAQMEVLGLARRSKGTQGNNLLEHDRVKLKVNFKKEKEQWKVIELEFLEPKGIYPLKNFIPLSNMRYFHEAF